MHDTSFVSLGRHLRRSIETAKNGHIKEFRPEIWQEIRGAGRRYNTLRLLLRSRCRRAPFAIRSPSTQGLLVHMQVGSVIHRNTLD